MNETEKPRRKPGSICPQFRKDVSKVCHTCEWYQNLKGEHPQKKDETIDQWGCSVVWNALVGVGIIQAVNKEVGGLHAATNSFRNEVVSQQAMLSGSAPRIVAQARIPLGEPILQLPSQSS